MFPLLTFPVAAEGFVLRTLTSIDLKKCARTWVPPSLPLGRPKRLVLRDPSLFKTRSEDRRSSLRLESHDCLML